MTFNNINNNNTSNLTLDINFVYPKNRKEIGECIKQFKQSSDVPKTRQEIADYIQLIKKPFREERMKLRLERRSLSTTTAKSTEPSPTTASISTNIDRIPKNRKEIGECIKQFKESSNVPKTRQEIVDYIQLIKKPFSEEKERNSKDKSTKSNNHCHHQHASNTNQKKDKIQRLTNKKLKLQNKIDSINVKIEFLSKSNQLPSTTAVDSNDSTLASN